MKTLAKKKNVRIIHFASRSSNSINIIKETTTTLKLKPEKTFTIYSYFENDPIVISKRIENSIILYKCIVNSIDYRTATIDLNIEGKEELVNNRKVDRYPVSLVGRINNYHVETTLYIENISSGGINFRTNIKLEVGSEIEVESNINGSYIKFTGNIVWVKEKTNLYEYGLNFVNTSPNIKRILKVVKKEHIKIW